MTENRWLRFLVQVLSYVLVAALAVCLTLAVAIKLLPGTDKLDLLKALIREQYIGQTDERALEDAAAAAMVSATGDRWSYYIPASQYEANRENLDNSYIGIGVTISLREDGLGVDVEQVEPTGGAKAAGILPGDILTHVEGQSVAELGVAGARSLIRGEEGTQVQVTILREGQQLELAVTRQSIQVQVADGQLLDGNIGLISIVNFNDRCAEETIRQIELLLEQGAKALIFDVRFNPGGFKAELVDLLDYLLPEGELFRSQYYDGREAVDTSDADCLQLPMAVLINGSSYSAAEFFAAALNEYEWAVLIGEPTVGKSYFQHTMDLGDGSAVALSVGKYYTPKGVSLAEEGGLQPEIQVMLDEQTAALVYSGMLDPVEDPQIQAAVVALQKK